MYGGLLKYSAIVTKLHALSGKLLTYKDFEAMSKLERVSDAVKMLQSRTLYGHEINMAADEVHRDVLEQKMRYGYMDNYMRISRYLNKNDRKFISAAMSKYETDILKKVIRNCIEGNAAGNGFLYDIPSEITKVFDFDVKKLAEADDLPDVLNVIEKSQYHKVISALMRREKSVDIFEVETNLDIYYFKNLWETAKKCYRDKKENKIAELVGNEADIFNVLWIYRCKRYYKLPAEYIYALLLPVHNKLSPEKIKRLVETESVDELKDMLSKSKYSGYFDFNNAALLEKIMRKTIIKIIGEQVKKNPYGVASVLLYLYKEELELENICSVAEGIRYGLPSEKILEYVVM